MKNIFSSFSVLKRYSFLGGLLSISIFLFSFYLFEKLKKEVRDRNLKRFEYRTSLAETAIKNRVISYTQILKGFKSLLTISDTVDKAKWKEFYQNQNIEENFPGIQGVGFARYVTTKQLDDFVNTVRKQYAEFIVFPKGEREVYTPILYIEPFEGKNLRAFGFDMFSDSTRRIAMEQARDENKPVISGKVKLIQETSTDVQAGFLLYLPVYKSKKNPETIEERRKNIIGFAYSPFRVRDLFLNILNGYPDLDIEIYDGDSASAKSILFNIDTQINYLDKDKGRYSSVSSLNIAGRKWKIHFRALESFDASSKYNTPYFTLGGGIVISILTLLVFYAYGNTKKADYLKQIITDNATAALFIIDEKGYCIFMNPSGKKMTGYDFKEIKQKPFHDLVHHSNSNRKPYPNPDYYMHEAFLNFVPLTSYEDIFRDKFGKNFNVICSSQCIYENGKPISTVMEVKDVTEEKRVEKEIKDFTNKLQVINTDLDNFVYTASHDLKAPIANLEGLVGALHKSSKDRFNESEFKIFEMMITSINRLKKTIGDLTEITKAQKDIDKEREELSFKELLKDVKEDLQPNINNSQPNIIEDLQVDQIRYVKKDLRSITYNLLSNALKFKASDRPLIVRITTYFEENFFVLRVQDNGLGIKKEYQKKLFTMFKRLHNHIEGTGIGLYILKRIVENKGGRIEVESNEGEGTTFKVFLKI